MQQTQSIHTFSHQPLTNTKPMATAAVEFYQSLAPGEPKVQEGTPGYKFDDVAYAMSRVPMRTPRAIKVICAGAGFSGLSFAREVEVGNIQNCELQIYEKNSTVGGTWFENRYPGCACDIPVHNYAVGFHLPGRRRELNRDSSILGRRTLSFPASMLAVTIFIGTSKKLRTSIICASMSSPLTRW